ncbi:hypothetical protein GA0070564_104195 [Micromonospora mirobrigensis]|uniref:Uncharacterized protein n=1 Tax=Micromonospora mirobrigensis TaxID=262898 RepID=A0A1C4YLS8_9ACTN|nr:hypothetical protein GA0070564_104195 [Micromonospora mirobrigensis]
MLAVLALAVILGVQLLGWSLLGRWSMPGRGGPDAEAHASAVADAGRTVQRVRQGFKLDHLYRADEYAHAAGQQPGVSVLSVRGETHWGTGVTLVLRVVGHGVAIGADGSVIRDRDLPICFRVQLGPQDDDQDDDIPCPAGEPSPVVPDPTLDGVDDRLRRALAGTGPDQAAVRAALAGLRLDPRVRQEVTAADGRVGVALRATRYDCLVARVTVDGAQLWRPSRVQLAPGELSCTAGLAFGAQFGRSPH